MGMENEQLSEFSKMRKEIKGILVLPHPQVQSSSGKSGFHRPTLEGLFNRLIYFLQDPSEATHLFPEQLHPTHGWPCPFH
jgi:hypothetical protein